MIFTEQEYILAAAMLSFAVFMISLAEQYFPRDRETVTLMKGFEGSL